MEEITRKMIQETADRKMRAIVHEAVRFLQGSPPKMLTTAEGLKKGTRWEEYCNFVQETFYTKEEAIQGVIDICLERLIVELDEEFMKFIWIFRKGYHDWEEEDFTHRGAMIQDIQDSLDGLLYRFAESFPLTLEPESESEEEEGEEEAVNG